MSIFARNIIVIEHDKLARASERELAEYIENIKNGDCYIAKAACDKKSLTRIRDYMVQIGQNSLPNYHRIEKGCPNFHRMNNWDERAYVNGCFHQFVFFPWNQDVFGLFERFKKIYQVKNRLSGLAPDKFLGVEPEDGCTARLAFQFYPRGAGGLNVHADPVDYHQLTVPTLCMSEYGVDYKEGGAYVETKSGERINLDAMTEMGDVVYFNGLVRHGVERIDPQVEPDWLAFEGRWILLFAVNKLSTNSGIANSTDLGKSASPKTP